MWPAKPKMLFLQNSLLILLLDNLQVNQLILALWHSQLFTAHPQHKQHELIPQGILLATLTPFQPGDPHGAGWLVTQQRWRGRIEHGSCNAFLAMTLPLESRVLNPGTPILSSEVWQLQQNALAIPSLHFPSLSIL